jgi:hypothetical protein
MDASDRPLKRKCLTFIDDDDMDWLKAEIRGIKKCVRDISDHLREHAGVDNN